MSPLQASGKVEVEKSNEQHFVKAKRTHTNLIQAAELRKYIVQEYYVVRGPLILKCTGIIWIHKFQSLIVVLIPYANLWRP